MRPAPGSPLYLGAAPRAGVGVSSGVGVEGASGRRLQPLPGGAGAVGGPQVGPRERALLAGRGPRGPLPGRAGLGAAPGGMGASLGVRPGLGGRRGQAVLRGGAGGAVPAQGVGAGHGHGRQLVQEPRQGPVTAPGGPILGPFGAAHDGLRERGDTRGKKPTEK